MPLIYTPPARVMATSPRTIYASNTTTRITTAAAVNRNPLGMCYYAAGNPKDSQELLAHTRTSIHISSVPSKERPNSPNGLKNQKFSIQSAPGFLPQIHDFDMAFGLILQCSHGSKEQ
ncbi:hypothetical protein K3495_g787 [Podosphaera aphanis]|nr:hypothetical protein K3495_g787 [Podosphaera aphanis]